MLKVRTVPSSSTSSERDIFCGDKQICSNTGSWLDGGVIVEDGGCNVTMSGVGERAVAVATVWLFSEGLEQLNVTIVASNEMAKEILVL